MMKEYEVTLSPDNYWDNIYKKYVIAENVEEAVKKANTDDDYIMKVELFNEE